MKTISALILIALNSPLAAFALTSVPFGGVHLQLQSNGTVQDSEKFLVEVLTQTVKYLDQNFEQDFAATSKFDFSHVGLSVETFDTSANKSFATFTFSGTVFFKSDATPPQDKIFESLVGSFLGKNNQAYTGILKKSDSPFLAHLSHAIVQVNGFESSPSAVAASKQKSPGNALDIQQIVVIAGVVSILVLFLLLCYCFCCVRAAADDDDVHQTPKKTKTEDTREEDDTSQSGGDVEAAFSPPPSSPRSFASQDSSIFTYNPTSRVSFDASTFSSNTTETNTVDLQSWQQRTTINSSRFAPFGHDISAIEMLNENRRDLSLIEEGDESATPVKSAAKATELLSKDLLSKLERQEQECRRKKSQESEDTSYMSHQSDTSSDVHTDLRNLSQQINHYRRR